MVNLMMISSLYVQVADGSLFLSGITGLTITTSIPYVIITENSCIADNICPMLTVFDQVLKNTSGHDATPYGLRLCMMISE